MFIGQFFNQNLNFGVLGRQSVISRVQEHPVTRNLLTLIKEEANPCSRNTDTMHMYKGQFFNVNPNLVDLEALKAI